MIKYRQTGFKYSKSGQKEAGVAKWQTQGTQNPSKATSCGFDSHHQHHWRKNCASA